MSGQGSTDGVQQRPGFRTGLTEALQAAAALEILEHHLGLLAEVAVHDEGPAPRTRCLSLAAGRQHREARVDLVAPALARRRLSRAGRTTSTTGNPAGVKTRDVPTRSRAIRSATCRQSGLPPRMGQECDKCLYSV
jgi:hypothetical protein